MKFGQRIKDARYEAWSDHYMNYSKLKKEIKSVRPWTEAAETTFVQHLSEELAKCELFQREKAEQVMKRIRELEAEVAALVKTADEYEASHDGEEVSAHADPERQIIDERDDDAGSDDEDDGSEDGILSQDSIEERFRELEEEVAVLVADVHDLALFTKLNFTGFVKIVKKHDKMTGFALKATFNNDYLKSHPFYKINYDPVIVKLSKLFDLVRTRGHPIEGDSSAGGSQNAFIRQTTKYWVHEENIVPLKLAIMKHLPVLVFDSNKEFEMKDAAITSIYYDNDALELYLGRLEKTEGAEAIRMRWYGDVDSKNVFVERKTHREDWTGEKSVKERVIIKEDKMNDFLAGRYDPSDDFDKMLASGKKTAKAIVADKQLAAEIQYAVIKRKLKPMVRTFYNRTAFQLPGNATVRISLDTELSMIREDNLDGVDRTQGNWRRKDVGIDYPFSNVAPKDKEIFPHAILEIKLSLVPGESAPEWVRDLINSHLVESVPKFSKFIHGCATLLPERVDLVPFWLPQMDEDIRKPVSSTSRVAIERPHSTAHSSTSAQTPIPQSPSFLGANKEPTYHEPVSEGEEDDEYLNQASKDEEAHLRLPPDVAAQARAARDFRETKLREEAVAQAAASSAANAGPTESAIIQRTEGIKHRYNQSLHIDPLAPADRFDHNVSILDAKSLQKLNDAAAAEEEGYQDVDGPSGDADREVGDATVYVSHFRAPAGKKIAVPVRVEPKVTFANERTFIKWLHFGILISAVSITMLNFITTSDPIGMFAAFCFTLTALVTILYAAGMFIYRTLKLRKRRDAYYNDRIGPVVLCIILMASIGVNLILRIREL